MSEVGPGNRVIVRLYDPLTGADVWKQNYAARSLVARSEDPSLAGVVEPDGKFHVVDLRTRKEVMAGRMEEEDVSEHLRNVQSVHLLCDRNNFYFAFQAPMAAPNNAAAGVVNVIGNNGMLSSVMTQQGMRTVPVNGYLYALERDSGEVAWFARIDNQFLILDQFWDLPLVLLTARRQEVQNQGGRMRIHQPVQVTAIEKRSGRIIFPDEKLETSNFFAVRVDARASTVELFSHNMRIAFRPKAYKEEEAREPKPAADTPAPRPRSGTRPNRPAVDRARIREVIDIARPER